MRWGEDERDDLRRIMLGKRSHLRRLYKDICRYGTLYRTPWIQRQIDAWKVDYRQTWDEYRALRKELGPH